MRILLIFVFLLSFSGCNDSSNKYSRENNPIPLVYTPVASSYLKPTEKIIKEYTKKSSSSFVYVKQTSKPTTKYKKIIKCSDSSCLYKNTCVSKPLHAYCVKNDVFNAWKCESGYLDTGVSCVKSVKPKYNAGCIDVTSYDYNWKNDMLCTRPDGSRFYTDYAGARYFESNLYLNTKSLRNKCTCIDVTSYDYNWKNDMFCTRSDGSQFYTDYEGARICTNN